MRQTFYKNNISNPLDDVVMFETTNKLVYLIFETNSCYD